MLMGNLIYGFLLMRSPVTCPAFMSTDTRGLTPALPAERDLQSAHNLSQFSYIFGGRIKGKMAEHKRNELYSRLPCVCTVLHNLRRLNCIISRSMDIMSSG